MYYLLKFRQKNIASIMEHKNIIQNNICIIWNSKHNIIYHHYILVLY